MRLKLPMVLSVPLKIKSEQKKLALLSASEQRIWTEEPDGQWPRSLHPRWRVDQENYEESQGEEPRRCKGVQRTTWEETRTRQGEERQKTFVLRFINYQPSQKSIWWVRLKPRNSTHFVLDTGTSRLIIPSKVVLNQVKFEISGKLTHFLVISIGLRINREFRYIVHFGF